MQIAACEPSTLPWVDGKPTFRCWNCRIVQFDKPERKQCVRCHATLQLVTAEVSTASPDPASPAPPAIEGSFPLTRRVALELRSCRKAKRISQRQLAKRLSIAGTAISKLERAGQRTSIRVLERMAAALGIDFGNQVQYACNFVYPELVKRDDFGIWMDEIAMAARGLCHEDREIILGAAWHLKRGEMPFEDGVRI
jgi:transcriptional regulator with XRE-family HTH domain